jgi:hypothetical protein
VRRLVRRWWQRQGEQPVERKSAAAEVAAYYLPRVEEDPLAPQTTESQELECATITGHWTLDAGRHRAGLGETTWTAAVAAASEVAAWDEASAAPAPRAQLCV